MEIKTIRFIERPLLKWTENLENVTVAMSIEITFAGTIVADRNLDKKSSNHALLKYAGTMEDFFDIFLNDHVYFSPFYEHINSFRQLNQLDHILFMNYDQMMANPFAAVKKIIEFSNYSYNDEQLH